MRLLRRLVPHTLAAVVGACGVLCWSTPVAAQRPLAGLWATDGYGQLIELTSDSLKTFEITRVSCMPGQTMAAVPAPAGALGAYGRMVTILPDGAQGARVHVGFAASDMILHRIARKPAVCDTPTPNTPRSNFDVFAATFAEHYPFFAERKVNWTAVVDSNRAKITDSTTPEQLFDVLAGMMVPLRDAHTGMMARAISRTAGGMRRTPSFIPPEEFGSAFALVTRYLAGPLHPFCMEQLEFGMLGRDIGYLRIRSFSRYSSSGSFATDTAALGAALDTIFSSAKAWKGMVIDVRINGGGSDPYGLLIAGRLTPTPYTAYVKQARNDPTDPTKWTPAQASMVHPTSRPSFHGAVVELIGVQSVSAAETFTQALLKRPVKVTRVGENTQGVFSDVLGRRLPNGWVFRLPNERFVTDGKSYDVVGIAPDVFVESLTPAARGTGKDAAIEKAIALLR
jgi:hypothetical protein